MIYTAIVGKYDVPRSDIKVFANGFSGLSDRLSSKLYKSCPHLWLAEPGIWLDGNIFPKVPESEIATLLDGADLAVFKHPFRSTVRQECVDILNRGCDTTELQRDFAALIDQNSLCECGVIIRKNTPEVRRFGRVWWTLICRYSVRDQVTFPIAVSLVPELRIKVIGANLREHPMFDFVPRK